MFEKSLRLKILIKDYKELIAKAKDEGYNSPKELPLEYLRKYVSLYQEIELALYYENRIDDIRKADAIIKNYDQNQLINEMEDVLAEKLGYHPEENIVVETDARHTDKKTGGVVRERKNLDSDVWDNSEFNDHYAKIKAEWLASKSEQQQKIWKLHFESMPKKTIAEKLGKDPKYVRVTIKRLTEDLIKKLPPLLKK